MHSLRHYQRAALDASYKYWETEGGSPLVELATGTGKSVVIATLIRELMRDYPSMRVLMLVHVKELVAQNAAAIIRAWPGAPVGVNCASLNRHDTQHAVLCASIQSIHDKVRQIGTRDLILIDEAHLVPKKSQGMYRTMLDTMEATTSPGHRLWGCSATPFRLDSGRLDEGEGRLFDRIIYSYTLAEGISEGFLSPLVSKATATKLDLSGVKRVGGEFQEKALAEATDQEAITASAVNEIVEQGHDRRSWLVFAASVAHAHHVRDALAARGIEAAVVSGKTPQGERDSILKAFKAGRLRCVVNMGVLTTGFDAPGTDLVALLRGTMSPGLLSQMVGRGTRLSPETGKVNCKVLDFAENIRRHGPIDDMVLPERKGAPGAPREKVEEETVKAIACAHCLSLNKVDAVTCWDCGEVLKPEQAEMLSAPHNATADDAPILSGLKSPLDWRPVDSVSFTRHDKMSILNAPATLKITYECGRKSFSEWQCFDHPKGGGAQKHAHRWWRGIGGSMPYPESVDEAVRRANAGDVGRIDAVRVMKEDGRDKVKARRIAKPESEAA